MAGFVKIDRGILNSTVWFNRDVRDVFLTALLMAELHELREPAPQLDVRTMEETGWVVPRGWYGMVPAAGIGIVSRAGVQLEAGTAALESMGHPEPDSRSGEFEGRRLVRVNGGYLVLNYPKYLERDYTNAERQRRWRERKKAAAESKSAKRRRRPPRGENDHLATELAIARIEHPDAFLEAPQPTKDEGEL